MPRQFFADADELAAHLTTCDSEICVRGRSAQPSSLNVARAGDIEFQATHVTPAVTAVGTLHRDLIQIAVPEARESGWTVQGRPFDLHNVHVTGPGRAYVAATEGAVRLLRVIIPLRHFIVRRSALHGGDAPATMPDGTLAPPLPLLKAAHQAIAVAYRFACRYPQLAARPGANWVVLGPLLDTLIRMIEPGSSTDDPGPVSPRLVRQLQEFIHAHDDQPLCLSELCAATHASERTVRNVFHKVYGTSPTRYLRLRRLNHAHRALRQSDPSGANVTDVAMQYGFLDVGRFASQYRQMFGEYPSQTLRRS